MSKNELVSLSSVEMRHAPWIGWITDLSAKDLNHAATNFRDKGRSNSSLVPFGYGDGGGGPTREMLAQAARTVRL